MTLDEALDISLVHVAINTTGRENVLVRRYTSGTLAAFKQKPTGSGWTRASTDYVAAVETDMNAWEPVREQSQLRISGR
jgi:hypothetical protein